MERRRRNKIEERGRKGRKACTRELSDFVSPLKKVRKYTWDQNLLEDTDGFIAVITSLDAVDAV